ncbi:MAG: transcriptional regulator [Armatimonadetes bacterium]|nr:transcriptional regulator [Armatimonadota bacterium]
MEFIETSIFTKLVYNYLTEDEYVGLQGCLIKRPDAGVVIPGSGGVRKLRWGAAGRGKRGSVRVIYYLMKQDDEIWLLTIYGKWEKANIAAHVLRQILKEFKNA